MVSRYAAKSAKNVLIFIHSLGGFFETDSLQELVEAGGNASVETVELGAAGVAQLGIGTEWTEQTGGQRSVDTFKKFKEHQADGVALGEQSIAVRARDFLNQSFEGRVGVSFPAISDIDSFDT